MATITVTPAIESTRQALIAPRWHTWLLIGIFLALTLDGALFQRAARAQPEKLLRHSHVLAIYLPIIVMEWGLVL
jgi:hypothetical protein